MGASAAPGQRKKFRRNLQGKFRKCTHRQKVHAQAEQQKMLLGGENFESRSGLFSSFRATTKKGQLLLRKKNKKVHPKRKSWLRPCLFTRPEISQSGERTPFVSTTSWANILLKSDKLFSEPKTTGKAGGLIWQCICKLGQTDLVSSL